MGDFFFNDSLQWFIDNGFLPNPNESLTYLFKDGDECTNITGGWSGSGTGNFANDNGQLTVTSTSNNHMYLYTNSKVDLTNYHTLTFIGNIFNDCKISISDNQTSDDGNEVAFSGNHSIDVSGYTGAYYIKIHPWNTGSYARFSKVYLR